MTGGAWPPSEPDIPPDEVRRLAIKAARINRRVSLAVLRIPGWEVSQSYKKKNSPWFKLYRHEVLNRYAFTKLTPTRRLQLLLIQALASEADRDNEIPLDLTWLSRRTSVRGTVDDLEALLYSGLLEVHYRSPPDADGRLPGRGQGSDDDSTANGNGSSCPSGRKGSSSRSGSNSGSEGSDTQGSEPGTSEPPITEAEIPWG